MLTPLALAALLSIAPPPTLEEITPPGDIGLSPSIELQAPPKPSPVRPPIEQPGGPTGPFDPSNPVNLGVAALLAAGAWESLDKHRRKLARRAIPLDVEVVFVPGHASEPGQVFNELIGHIGIAPEQAHEFNWLLAMPEAPSAKEASKRASVGAAADAIEEYVGELAGGGSPVYIVGYSKGGAAVAEMLAIWDRDPSRRVEGVYGAALLDPPISGGPLGWLQSFGTLGIDMANDGGYSPYRSRWFGLLPPEDTREHLGAASGVETVVFRNRDAVFTNFGDNPEGLRVYDIEDPGPNVFGAIFDGPLERMGEAHSSVVRHPLVGQCIAEELVDPGSCDWPQPSRPSVFQPSNSVGGAGMTGNFVL